MGLLGKLLGKADPPSSRLVIWFKERAEAERAVTPDPSFSPPYPTSLRMILSLEGALTGNPAGVSFEQSTAIMEAVLHGKYKIAPRNKNGVDGFDLIISY